ncbi:HugZ family pyridoxamine 5'-phosphate oxidase [Oceanibacterium hippocampi]|uniref:Pyridoxamine 5'-phosphate oxidase n=1 Tax=Oceanibacterium hippocampi TaxID=745714 RepID=A0A1Y5RQE5_9PROT|nr:DUF2470 domain-containing protein [Oceanibacterium hippocampi]SLN22011.1 Pyridoxamine 5'-phosphate oxidase [Oceanibacterium hippocampi]
MTDFDDAAAVEARRLLRGTGTATLATLDVAGGGPYASLVQVATDLAGRPLLLLSGLARHTANLIADPRVSLLFDGTAGLAERLTGPRLSLQGGIARIDKSGAGAERFLRRHPGAAGYVGFGDFALYQVEPAEAHLVAGFGRIVAIAAAELLAPVADPLAEAEEGIVAHMNDDHADALDLYATRLLGRSGRGWRMTGIDGEGIDLALAGETARLAFPRRIADAADARAVLVELVGEAQSRGATAD